MNLPLGMYLVLLLFLAQAARAQIATDQPQLRRGQLDLGSWSTENMIVVDGEWLVLPDQHLDAVRMQSFDFLRATAEPGALHQKSAALFETTSLRQLKGKHASYVMLVKNRQARSLGLEVEGYKNDFEVNIHIPAVNTFFRLDSYGEPQRNEPVAAPYATPNRYYNLDAVGYLGQDFYIIINSRAAAIGDGNGLGVAPMKLGSSAQIEAREFRKRIEQFTILGIYAMLVFYSFTIFLLRPADRSSLTVGLLALTLGLRYVATERLLVFIPEFYPWVGYLFFFMKFFYACSAIAIVTFVFQNFRAHFSRRMLSVAQLVLLFGLLDSVGTLISNSTLTLAAGLLFIVGFGLALVPYFVYLGWRGRHAGGLFSSVSLTLFSMSMANDFYQAVSGRLDPMWLGHFGMLALSIGFALVNAKVFSNTYDRAVELNDTLDIRNKEILKANDEITYFNRNLEHLVQQKTQEITALLDHIPQGVLSLEPGGIISRDFSRHLVDIVEDSGIAGRSFKELLLDRSNLNADVRDQVWQALQAVIGELDINFDMNADKLPSELGYKTHHGLKWLKLTWNVETSDGIVRRMLVTLLDVTKEKVLQEEAEAQRHEFEFIRELIEAGERKIAQYFVSANALLRENEKILEKPASEIDHPDIQCLFINLHTVKGGARTLGLKELARVFHEVEEYYQDILRHGLAIEKDKLLADMQNAVSMYQHYQNVNTRKLNRSGDFSKVVINRDFVEAHYHILRDIVVDLDRKDQPLDSIIQRIHSQKDTIVRLIFDQLPAVFDEYKSKAEKIAKEVNKPKPHFDFQLDSISITPEMKALLDNCMVHLLRNALCHGIENPEDRVRHGKAEVGTITIKSQVQGSTLNLEIHDDGRGLAIHTLKEKGLESGRLPDTATVQEVAELIFAPGVSTATMVTHISGRGVGMDAVRKFLEQEGGGVEIRLGNPKDESRQYYNFKFLIHIPLKKAKTIPLFAPRIA
jgi:HPt (histidine-containing phosphotransfer) domain-containing protein